MKYTLDTRFLALTDIAKVRVLANLIHAGTVRVRSIHLDNPADSETIYATSEAIHYLSGYILRLLATRADEEADEGIAYAVVRLIEAWGSFYVEQLAEWIEAEA